jgi:hypothetical protein
MLNPTLHQVNKILVATAHFFFNCLFRELGQLGLLHAKDASVNGYRSAHCARGAGNRRQALRHVL